MVCAKLVTIMVPFVFKELVDELNGESTEDDDKRGISPQAVAAVPVSLVLSYGIARTLSNILQEMRDAVFSKVSQKGS